MNLAQAAALVSRYGNVGEESQLLAVAPTESQLQEAAYMCYRAVDRAVDLLREHHGLPKPGLQLPPTEKTS